MPQKPAAAELERRADGSIILRSMHQPGDVPANLAAILRDRAAEHPDRLFIAQREADHGPWRELTYAAARVAGDSIAQWLIDREMSCGDAVLVISGNSLEHAMLMLGCYTAGVPIAPVSAAYSLMSQDHAKLLHCFEKVRPRVVFAQSGAAFLPALARLREASPDLTIVICNGSPGDGIAFTSLLETPPGSAVDARLAAIEPDSVGKYLFTSGSTGMPKCVAQTQRMMTAVIAGAEGLASEPREVREPPVTLEWMPWSHVSGGNIFFNGAIWNGGTMYLDEGRPAPGLFDTTIKNLYEISPTIFGSAPIAFAMLADAMEGDARLRAMFFKRVASLGYGGATLSNDLYDRIQALAVAETGRRIPITTMYGATETQGVTMVHWEVDRVGLIGLPMPGTELKLAPSGDKLEVRVRGASVGSGYVGDEEKSASAFDEEGFYKLGDAARLVDPQDPNKGLVFDGRVTEDFKLSSGTWVSVGTLRPDIVSACSPLIFDCVVAGQDKPCVGVLVWPNPLAMQKYGETFGADLLTQLGSDIAAHLRRFNSTAGGNSRRVGKFKILTTPPSLDAGEITDKGYVNQRAALDTRAEDVADLYAEQPRTTVFEV